MKSALQVNILQTLILLKKMPVLFDCGPVPKAPTKGDNLPKVPTASF
jgi:hypothetical protein